jgi:uncharacterized protein (TIGR03435 family)
MAGRDDLGARVAALLDSGQPRGPVGRRVAAAMIATAVAAMIGVAPITVARAMPQGQVTSPAPSTTTFADASIKRLPNSQMRRVDGRITATGLTVQNLLTMAFAVREVVDAPYWVRTDRFDIVANAPNDVTPTGESKILQALLAERFKLVAHRESKDFPVYALVQAQPNRQGTRLTPSQFDCSNRANCGLSSSAGRLTGRGITMAELVRVLPTHLGSMPGGPPFFDRRLMDRTGLSGRFDFHMEWEQDKPGAAASDPASSAPRFLAALQQLGLTIESQMAPAPVLVIDSIEPPTEN